MSVGVEEDLRSRLDHLGPRAAQIQLILGVECSQCACYGVYEALERGLHCQELDHEKASDLKRAYE